eukprot:TRINITY_DN61594_c0_g1_i1.p1 TRINITY_DN61594_c0_g1~~TRINITY_DN61594_c0_g1_i1.p1  ORF type:complete len:707 (+),score=56.78 TRINITY_DN61594_c0_g1_i1:61-2181(+)
MGENRLVPSSVLRYLSIVFVLIHAEVYTYLAISSTEVCGIDEPTKCAGATTPCLNSCEATPGIVYCSPSIPFNQTGAICGGQYPLCRDGICMRSAAIEGVLFPAVFSVMSCCCIIFVIFVSGVGVFVPTDFILAFEDIGLRLAILFVAFIVNIDYHVYHLALGELGGFKFQFALPYANALMYLCFLGMFFCIVATAPRLLPIQGSRVAIRVSHLAVLIYLVQVPLYANFSGLYRGDPYFIGTGSIFWFTMSYLSNEHILFLEKEDAESGVTAALRNNYMAPVATALFVWKFVVAFLYQNLTEIGDFNDLTFSGVVALLLQIDGMQVGQHACLLRDLSWFGKAGELGFLRSVNMLKTRDRLRQLQRFISCWVGQVLIQVTNNAYNGIYFAATLQIQLSAIRSNMIGGAPASSIIYGIITLYFLGTAIGIIQLCALKCGLFAKGVPDRSFRLVFCIKYAAIWLKIVLLRFLQDKQGNSWNTVIVYMNTGLTLAVSIWSGWCMTTPRSIKLHAETRKPVLLSVCFLSLQASFTGISVFFLAFYHFTPTFIAEIPDWLLPAMPAFYLLTFGPLVVEGARYMEDCDMHPSRLQSCRECESVHFLALWVAWCFPLQIVLNFLVSGLTSVDLLKGMFTDSHFAPWYEHALMTILSVCAWIASIGIASGSTPKVDEQARPIRFDEQAPTVRINSQGSVHSNMLSLQIRQNQEQT